MSEKDFDKGYKSGFNFGKELANEEWLKKVKQAREEICLKAHPCIDSGNRVLQYYCDGLKASLKILDKLIESEGE